MQRSRYKRAACQELYLYLAARTKSRANGVDGGPGGRGGRWMKGKGQLARAGINKHQQATSKQPTSNQQTTSKLSGRGVGRIESWQAGKGGQTGRYS